MLSNSFSFSNRKSIFCHQAFQPEGAVQAAVNEGGERRGGQRENKKK